MSLILPPYRVPPVQITTLGRYGLASGLACLQTTTTPDQGTESSANLATYVPMKFDYPVVATQFFLYTGSVSVANFDIGLYDENFNRLVNCGSTALQGSVGMQYVNITDYLIVPGRYYMAFVCASAVNIGREHMGNIINSGLLGVLQESGAGVPLPATGTPGVATSVFVPNVGFTTKWPT